MKPMLPAVFDAIDSAWENTVDARHIHQRYQHGRRQYLRLDSDRKDTHLPLISHSYRGTAHNPRPARDELRLGLPCRRHLEFLLPEFPPPRVTSPAERSPCEHRDLSSPVDHGLPFRLDVRCATIHELLIDP